MLEAAAAPEVGSVRVIQGAVALQSQQGVLVVE
jgi:hypothetical protein